MNNCDTRQPEVSINTSLNCDLCNYQRNAALWAVLKPAKGRRYIPIWGLAGYILNWAYNELRRSLSEEPPRGRRYKVYRLQPNRH
ncbi:hypothetical protein [Kamptonema sp. UHCC 0994]|uniref:hypothetical protein n=1 Tax=Kamptonema sp. UHCC 0994 TaxID=3031329 RepID=UPI0023B8E81D|nr:hypothetical protein [Kamptonema sp. UHCC 0994]MDF0554626.1 hypothetical protein [Kamptonema sp. UHCC 0994]